MSAQIPVLSIINYDYYKGLKQPLFYNSANSRNNIKTIHKSQQLLNSSEDNIYISLNKISILSVWVCQCYFI